VTHEHPTDPFRPQVKIIRDAQGEPIESPFLVNTWERDLQGDYTSGVVDAVDPEVANIDPLSYLNAEGAN
jgi:hypothetical protein